MRKRRPVLITIMSIRTTLAKFNIYRTIIVLYCYVKSDIDAILFYVLADFVESTLHILNLVTIIKVYSTSTRYS